MQQQSCIDQFTHRTHINQIIALKGTSSSLVQRAFAPNDSLDLS